MQNYKETTVSGTSYVRANEVSIKNALNGYKGIMFVEEEVSILGEKILRENVGPIHQEFSAENASTEFELLNPVTNEPIGSTATYQDVYVLLFSLYYHLAAARDAANETANEVTTQPE